MGLRRVRVFDDYRQMFGACDLDAVCIGLPTWMHAPVSQEAVQLGLHVLCEKPPSNDATELMPVTQLAETKGLVYMFVRQSRFTSQLMEGRRLVQAGELGDVYYAETRWIRTRWCSARGWRHDKAKGGGVLLDLGIHAIDNVWFMMGCPRPTEVMAGLYCTFSDLAPPEQTYTADDAACGFVRFENGCTLAFCCRVFDEYDEPAGASGGKRSGQKRDAGVSTLRHEGGTRKRKTAGWDTRWCEGQTHKNTATKGG